MTERVGFWFEPFVGTYIIKVCQYPDLCYHCTEVQVCIHQLSQLCHVLLQAI